jgi:hypothetical protein
MACCGCDRLILPVQISHNAVDNIHIPCALLHAMPRFCMPFHAVSCHAMPYHAVSRHAMLCCNVSCCSVLYEDRLPLLKALSHLQSI